MSVETEALTAPAPRATIVPLPREFTFWAVIFCSEQSSPIGAVGPGVTSFRHPLLTEVGSIHYIKYYFIS